MMNESVSHGRSLELIAVRKRYGKQLVLNNINLSVEAGSFTSLVGPSGSGKTTTLSVVAGLVRPDSGAVEVGGVDVTSRPPHRRNLGFVFQDYALFPHMTVEKNIGYPLKLRGVPRSEIKRKVADAIALVRLDGLGKRHPAQLSGGQRQRVAFARAIVFDPELLLMDEPLGALDASLRAHLQREIVRIGREIGITILYVTHDQDEALSMSDNIVVFNNGAVEQVGTPQQIYNSPQTAFVANFFGTGALVQGHLGAGADPYVTTGTGNAIRVSSGSVANIGAGTGDRVAILLRPEFLGIREIDGPDPLRLNPIGNGRITDVVYHGGSARVRVQVDGYPELTSRMDPGVTERFRVGDTVIVGLFGATRPPVVPLQARTTGFSDATDGSKSREPIDASV
jgi:putative spermidine/putrescine transport system ATP-binding protein